jgi:CheY-like chemotaxis protein
LKGQLDGVQAARIIQDTLRPVPVVFLTAHKPEDFPHLSGLKQDSYLYLTKPYFDRDLLRAIDKVLG